MYAFKILPCAKRASHDWTTCPFVHPGEKARRRDPRTCSYLAVPCPDIKQNQACPRGDSCQYCHSVFEYWLHPSRYRTQLCQNGSNCRRAVCFFAHSLEDLRTDPSHLLEKKEAADAAAAAAAAGGDAAAGGSSSKAGGGGGAAPDAGAAPAKEQQAAQKALAAQQARATALAQAQVEASVARLRQNSAPPGPAPGAALLFQGIEPGDGRSHSMTLPSGHAHGQQQFAAGPMAAAGAVAHAHALARAGGALALRSAPSDPLSSLDPLSGEGGAAWWAGGGWDGSTRSSLDIEAAAYNMQQRLGASSGSQTLQGAAYTAAYQQRLANDQAAATAAAAAAASGLWDDQLSIEEGAAAAAAVALSPLPRQPSLGASAAPQLSPQGYADALYAQQAQQQAQQQQQAVAMQQHMQLSAAIAAAQQQQQVQHHQQQQVQQQQQRQMLARLQLLRQQGADYNPQAPRDRLTPYRASPAADAAAAASAAAAAAQQRSYLLSRRTSVDSCTTGSYSAGLPPSSPGASNFSGGLPRLPSAGAAAAAAAAAAASNNPLAVAPRLEGFSMPAGALRSYDLGLSAASFTSAGGSSFTSRCGGGSFTSRNGGSFSSRGAGSFTCGGAPGGAAAALRAGLDPISGGLNSGSGSAQQLPPPLLPPTAEYDYEGCFFEEEGGEEPPCAAPAGGARSPFGELGMLSPMAESSYDSVVPPFAAAGSGGGGGGGGTLQDHLAAAGLAGQAAAAAAAAAGGDGAGNGGRGARNGGRGGGHEGNRLLRGLVDALMQRLQQSGN